MLWIQGMKTVLPLLAMPIFVFAVAAAQASVLSVGAEMQAGMPYAIPEIRLEAPEADQGVASDGTFIYAVDNSEIGKYAAETGERVAGFAGDAEAFPHMNSCAVVERDLVCAASNYPKTPHAGRVEFFRASDLRHERTVVLPDNPGSLTVLDRHDGRWWAVFANYDGRGGVPGQDHTATLLVRLDDDFRVERSWTLPSTVLERLAPFSISGGSWGRDGLFYASGHDKPEIYVLAIPEAGGTLRHVGTFATASFGQAIAIDPRDPDRLWSIDRATRSVLASRIPSRGER